MSLEFASLTGTFAVGQDGVEQLPVPLGGFEDRVEGTESSSPVSSSTARLE